MMALYSHIICIFLCYFNNVDIFWSNTHNFTQREKFLMYLLVCKNVEYKLINTAYYMGNGFIQLRASLCGYVIVYKKNIKARALPWLNIYIVGILCITNQKTFFLFPTEQDFIYKIIGKICLHTHLCTIHRVMWLGILSC